MIDANSQLQMLESLLLDACPLFLYFVANEHVELLISSLACL
jgi:hypothetical protein